MIKDTWEKNEDASANKKEITVLKEHFPACFKEDGSFDIERFKEYLSEDINVVNEGYELKFLGKNYARLLVTLETETVIVPNEEHNQKEENKDSENIYITGDNLDGLKHLLKSYAGKVKCIYIDPPYNTGSDGFVYNDNFNFTPEELTEKLSIGEEQAQRILDLTKRGSASHSAWLMFMYPRLQLARDILSEDGVIFISIDDNEHANLKILCDDIFGEDSFLSTLTWEKRTKSQNTKDAKYMLQSKTEYILVYKRTNKNYKFNLEVSNSKVYDLEDEKGKYRLYKIEEMSNLGIRGRQTMVYPIKGIEPNENQQWKLGQDTIKYYMNRGDVVLVDNWPYIKMRPQDEDAFSYKPFWSHFLNKEAYGTAETGNSEVKNIFGLKDVFDTVKPVELIKKIIYHMGGIENDKDFYVLDFFSGSSTTAHSILKLNAEDNGKRKFIMVQISDKTNDNSSASKLGFKSIDEIGRERIVRVAKEIREESLDTTIDFGFKHFILKEPTNETVNKLVEFNPDENKLFADKTLLDEFGVPTVITTWLNNDGYGLTTEVEKITFAGYETYYKDKHLYLVHPELPNEAIEELVVKYETDGNFNPENIVLFGYSFTWTELESLKTNLKRLQDTEKNLRINFDVRY
ncbi:site-specific DNA-methyltransferase [Aerococcus urinaeequi]|uniref:site-specific DNA-methyltransferase n=1 Tax=Aerococcus urinaeequi TaxID=51665 RepID=UPI003D6A3C4A